MIDKKLNNRYNVCEKSNCFDCIIEFKGEKALKQNKVEHEEEYEYKYMGDHNNIDLNTLLISQHHFAIIMKEIQSEVCPNIQMKIKIQAFKKGTFNVIHLYELFFDCNLALGPDALKYAKYIKDIFSVLVDYTKIREFLNGKRATNVIKSENSPTITLINNGTLTIQNSAFYLYQTSPVLDMAYRKNIQAIEADAEITGVSIKDTKSKKALIELPRKKFSKLLKPSPYFDKVKKEEIKRASIYIKKPDLYPKHKSKWSFVYKKRPIEATITDPQFIQRINSGERFGQGDALTVDLITYLEMDDTCGQYVETGKFEISRVYDIDRNPPQCEMF